MQRGDFVKIFGQVKTSIDNNGKEHKNVRILSSKLLKSKEQVKSQDKDKKSILGQINISTHSSFVLNKLGLENLILLSNKKALILQI